MCQKDWSDDIITRYRVFIGLMVYTLDLVGDTEVRFRTDIPEIFFLRTDTQKILKKIRCERSKYGRNVAVRELFRNLAAFEKARPSGVEKFRLVWAWDFCEQGTWLHACVYLPVNEKPSAGAISITKKKQ